MVELVVQCSVVVSKGTQPALALIISEGMI